MRPAHLLDFLEATYALETDELTWLNNVVAAMKAIWGVPGWAFGTTYDASNVADLRPKLITMNGAAADLSGVLAQGATLLPTDYVERRFRRTLTFWARQGVTGQLAGIFEQLEQAGAPDLFVVNGCDPAGNGCALAVSADREQGPSRAEQSIYRQMANHLAAALRCRQRLAATAQQRDDARKPDVLSGAEAVFDRRGKLVHAEGPAELRPAQSGLREALRRYEAARSRRRGTDPVSSLERHRPLVDARWTLVEAYEQGGVRYVVARENRPALRGLAALSERERQVVVYLALGRSTKEIAYALGISDSTVRVLLARAATRLRVRNRQQLVRLATRQSLPELARAGKPR
jgi:DNA-binding CsgD family transcriptional regulator